MSKAMAGCRRVAAAPRGAPGEAPRQGRDRPVGRSGRLGVAAGAQGGEATGPNPTDRGRAGSKHHAVVDAKGVPLAVVTTGANRNDVTQLVPLVEAIPAARGRPGRPLRVPKLVVADGGYDHDKCRMRLSCRGIATAIARRGVPHGSGLGRRRWYVERTLSWLHQFKRLRVRWERLVGVHDAFVKLACCLICWRTLERLC